MGAVELTILPWTSGKLGLGPGKARLSEPIAAGETVESLLERLSERLPGFVEWVYDRPERRVHEHCTLLVNGRAFEGLGGLAAELRPGDELTILPGFSGGAPLASLARGSPAVILSPGAQEPAGLDGRGAVAPFARRGVARGSA